MLRRSARTLNNEMIGGELARYSSDRSLLNNMLDLVDGESTFLPIGIGWGDLNQYCKILIQYPTTPRHWVTSTSLRFQCPHCCCQAEARNEIQWCTQFCKFCANFTRSESSLFSGTDASITELLLRSQSTPELSQLQYNHHEYERSVALRSNVHRVFD